MTEETPQDIQRLKVLQSCQSFLSQHLQQTAATVSEKYSKELKASQTLENELSRLKSEYLSFLSSSQQRETTLLNLLQQKDQELGENLSQLSALKSSNQEILQEKELLLEELSQIKSQPPLESNSVCSECDSDNEDGTLKNLETELERFTLEWKETGEDSWEENAKKTVELNERVKGLQEELESNSRTLLSLNTEKSALELQLTQISGSQSCKALIESQLHQTETELQAITESYQDLQEKHQALCEKLEIYKFDKEVLRSKLEKVNEMLEQEKLTSSVHAEELNKEKILTVALEEKLSFEKQANSVLSEAVIQEKISVAKAREQMLRATDIDVILAETLKKIDMEGQVKKTEEGYFYNNTLINLSLFSECFVVVKIGAGLMPLEDYLKNTYLPGQALHSRHNMSDTKVENVQPSRQIKSPMRNLVSFAAKTTKTPLRDRNHSAVDRKRPFK